MADSLFKPSPFWVAVRPVFSVKFLGALVIMAGVLEVVARLSPIIVAHTVHQPYLASQRPCQIDCEESPARITWLSNERGTRGDLYHGQPVRIATLGSSTTACSLLDQQQTWPEQLKATLGAGKVHVDNYARDGATYRETTRILDRVAVHGPRYDLILIMMHVSTRDARRSGANDRSAFQYWGQWAFGHSAGLVGPRLARRRVSAQLRTEPRVLSLWEAIRDPFLPPAAETARFDPIARSNRALRNTGKVKLVDEEYSFTEAEIEGVREHTREMLTAASNSEANVFLVLQPVAFDEYERPEVAEKWVSLYEASGERGAYLSNRSIAWGMREINRIMKAEADAIGVPVIDLDAEFRPILRQRGDLFDDKWHFAPSGAAIAGERLAATLLEQLPQLFDGVSGQTLARTQPADSRLR